MRSVAFRESFFVYEKSVGSFISSFVDTRTRITGQFSVTNPWGEGRERDFQVAHSSRGRHRVCYLAEKSRTLETDIFSRSDIHPRRREWLGSAFVKDPLTVAFCIYAPAQDRPRRERERERERKSACSGKKFDLKPLRKKNGDEPMKARKGGG